MYYCHLNSDRLHSVILKRRGRWIGYWTSGFFKISLGLVGIKEDEVFKNVFNLNLLSLRRIKTFQ